MIFERFSWFCYCFHWYGYLYNVVKNAYKFGEYSKFERGGANLYTFCERGGANFYTFCEHSTLLLVANNTRRRP